jgi:hypothetical protein
VGEAVSVRLGRGRFAASVTHVTAVDDRAMAGATPDDPREAS